MQLLFHHLHFLRFLKFIPDASLQRAFEGFFGHLDHIRGILAFHLRFFGKEDFLKLLLFLPVFLMDLFFHRHGDFQHFLSEQLIPSARTYLFLAHDDGFLAQLVFCADQRFFHIMYYILFYNQRNSTIPTTSMGTSLGTSFRDNTTI